MEDMIFIPTYLVCSLAYIIFLYSGAGRIDSVDFYIGSYVLVIPVSVLLTWIISKFLKVQSRPSTFLKLGFKIFGYPTIVFLWMVIMDALL